MPRFRRACDGNANLIRAVPYRAVLTAAPLHGPDNFPRDKHERERKQRMCQNFGHLRDLRRSVSSTSTSNSYCVSQFPLCRRRVGSRSDVSGG